MSSHRILYIGHDLTLLKTLTEVLEDCQMVRCPGGSVAHTLIKSQISYSLILLDEVLPDTTGMELAHLAQGVQHRQHIPIIILSASKARCACPDVCFKKPEDLKSLVRAIKHLIAGAANAAQ